MGKVCFWLHEETDSQLCFLLPVSGELGGEEAMCMSSLSQQDVWGETQVRQAWCCAAKLMGGMWLFHRVVGVAGIKSHQVQDKQDV